MFGHKNEELLYTFIKVPGETLTGLENSRPAGLLEILHKASCAFDYAAITTDVCLKAAEMI